MKAPPTTLPTQQSGYPDLRCSPQCPFPDCLTPGRTTHIDYNKASYKLLYASHSASLDWLHSLALLRGVGPQFLKMEKARRERENEFDWDRKDQEAARKWNAAVFAMSGVIGVAAAVFGYFYAIEYNESL